MRILIIIVAELKSDVKNQLDLIVIVDISISLDPLSLCISLHDYTF